MLSGWLSYWPCGPSESAVTQMLRSQRRLGCYVLETSGLVHWSSESDRFTLGLVAGHCNPVSVTVIVRPAPPRGSPTAPAGRG